MCLFNSLEPLLLLDLLEDDLFMGGGVVLVQKESGKAKDKYTNSCEGEPESFFGGGLLVEACLMLWVETCLSLLVEACLE